MDPILIYGHPAGSSMGLLAALEWLEMPYRVCRVDMLGEMQEAVYRRLNPRVETPALIADDGRIITETMAISAWLETRDVDRKISFDPRPPQTDLMHQFIGFINTGFTGAFGPLWVALEMDPPNTQIQDVLRNQGREAVIERHDRLEEMIGNTTFLVGERPGLADGILVGVARWLDVHEVASPDRWPRLAEVRRRIEATDAVRLALALEDGDSAVGSGACKGHVPLGDVIDQFGQ